MRLFLDLTKSGIVTFVLIGGFAGYALSRDLQMGWDWTHLIITLLSLYFLSSGSFALNQAQEWEVDKKMPRTENRPIPAGHISVGQAYFLGIGFVVIGLFFGFLVNQTVALLGLATVVLYNLLYTLFWKKRWTFGAVPGAIPGAMPVMIGYAANNHEIWNANCVYAFLIMFLWQMPHFWSLAIRFKDDYNSGGIPVLPTQVGTAATKYHMGLYMFPYVALALASPLFTSVYLLYIFLVIPLSFKIMFEFLKFFKTQGGDKWLPFFLWTNLSVLIFLLAPVLDKWLLSLVSVGTT